ncbi:MAG: nicotinamide mononucleotide transporter [Clostridia bacterium]|nr:nicotinamide mononucleotide transporter [Clostridia bacterium]
MKISNPFKRLTKFEWLLWLCSLIVVTGSFMIPAEKDYLTLIASLIGITALIFVAKGLVIGQILIVIFAVFYGIISFYFRYYGEMITYLGMSAPIALLSVVSWIRHPAKTAKEVEVHHMTRREIVIMFVFAVITTVIFYFILGLMNTANLFFSTISVTTSFLASYLTFMRSPYYALTYALNDLVLIVLWVAASMTDVSSLPMVMCFVMFFVNDLYGFFNWRRMEKRQREI